MTAEERIAALDGRFVAIYEAARRRRLDAQMGRALLLVVDDVMLFYHGGREPEVIPGMRPPLYDKLKTLSHVSLAIYCLLSGRSGDEAAAPPDLLDDIRDYRAQLAATADDLDADEAFEAGLLPHRVEIYARSLAFLDRVIAEERARTADLAAFCRANVRDLNACFAAATRVQLDACHAEILCLKESVLSAEDWAALRVVVMGPHMAHKDENFLQYFARLLHSPMYKDKRVVYFEGEDRAAALDLMGTALLDLEASQVIFDDEMRLHRDVLADATKVYLDELFVGEKGADAKPRR